MIHFSDSDMFGWRREQIAASGIKGIEEEEEEERMK